jgi:MFS family permease
MATNMWNDQLMHYFNLQQSICKTLASLNLGANACSWFSNASSIWCAVSIAAFGMLMGSLIAGPIANLIGRKWTCIFGTCGCLASSYALIAGAQWLWMLLLGRFLHGTGDSCCKLF